MLGAGNISFLVYLLNPFTIAVCVGGSTSSIENMLIILCLYGAATGLKSSWPSWSCTIITMLYSMLLFIHVFTINVSCLIINLLAQLPSATLVASEGLSG